MPEWITVRTPGDRGVATSRAPFDLVTTEALVRAARRVRREPSADPHFSIYVVLLEFAADDYGLYVGRTGLTPRNAFGTTRRATKRRSR